MVLYGARHGADPPRPPTEAIMGVVSRSQGRRRLGRQRRHPAHRRDPRRRRARQRLCLQLRIAAHRHRPARGARPGHRPWPTNRSRAAYAAGRRPRPTRPPCARAGAAARVHHRVPARPHDRRRGGGRSRGDGGGRGRRVPPRPAQPAGPDRTCRRGQGDVPNSPTGGRSHDRTNHPPARRRITHDRGPLARRRQEHPGHPGQQAVDSRPGHRRVTGSSQPSAMPSRTRRRRLPWPGSSRRGSANSRR